MMSCGVAPGHRLLRVGFIGIFFTGSLQWMRRKKALVTSSPANQCSFLFFSFYFVSSDFGFVVASSSTPALTIVTRRDGVPEELPNDSIRFTTSHPS